MSDTINVKQLGGSDVTQRLNKTGYQTIFDIAVQTRDDFIEKNPDIPAEEAGAIYDASVGRVGNLEALYRAWQLHADPALQNIPKLSAEKGLSQLHEAFTRNLGGDSDFASLFPERSADGYVDPASIQSLFSPARYLCQLYDATLSLYHDDNPLDALTRRPDLKDLRLDEANTFAEISTLEILISAMHVDPAALSNVYYPMSLPYDDHLTQIRAALSQAGTDLNRVWDVLLDSQKNAFANPLDTDAFRLKPQMQAGVTAAVNPRARELLGITPNTFKLLISEAAGVTDIANHYNVSASDTSTLTAALNVMKTFQEKTRLSFNKVLELTAQMSYTSKSDEYASNYWRYGSSRAQVNEYGAVFLNQNQTTPVWVRQYDNAENAILNFEAGGVVQAASRAEKLIRLSLATGMSFEELDWLIVVASKAQPQSGASVSVTIGPTVLYAIAEYMHLRKRYGIASGLFASFIGMADYYAPLDQKSLYQQYFSTEDGSKTIYYDGPVTTIINGYGEHEAICCRALRVTTDELYRIIRYCWPNSNQQFEYIKESEAGMLLRMGQIPNMLGLSFTEAELLWKIMDDGKGSIISTIAQTNANLQTLDVIRKTEMVLDWMESHKLTVATLYPMVTKQFSNTADSEMFNFLQTIYQTLKGYTTDTATQPASFEGNLYQLLSAKFNLKTNVMKMLVTWLSIMSPYTWTRNCKNKVCLIK